MTDVPHFPAPSATALDPWEAARLAEAEAARAAAVRARAGRLAALRNRLARLDEALADLLAQRARARRRILDEGLNPFAPPFAPSVFWAVVAVMLALEVPVNKAALDVLLLPELEAWMLALFLGLANLFAAKATARALRQARRADGVWPWLLAGFVNALLVAAVAAVAVLRARASGAGDLPWAFLALQLLFYAVALFLAFQQTAPDPAAEQAHRHLARLDRALARADRRRARAAAAHDRALIAASTAVAAVEQAALAAIAARRARVAAELGPDAPDWSAPLGPDLFAPLVLGRPAPPSPAA